VSLDDWLRRQGALHPNAIELGLDRVRAVAERLRLARPPHGVFTVAGTNGKGSTVGLLAALLTTHGYRTAVYTSPHLVRYNERVRVAGVDATDAELIAAFEAVEAAREDVPLTYFEFGTLAALVHFVAAAADAWVLEVGLGGRLDAVNLIDPDVSLVTTVDLDHQDWLGDTIEAIAAEKAGIFRPGRPALYGDAPVPASLAAHAQAIAAPLRCLGQDFGFRRHASGWDWWGGVTRLDGLSLPAPGDDAQLRNATLALAAAQSVDATLLARAAVEAALQAPRPPGRFQVLPGDCEWVLDVAHNPQAARILATRLAALPARPTTIVAGLLRDKDLDGVIGALDPLASRWIACGAGEAERERSSADLAAALRHLTGRPVLDGGTVAQAMALAREEASPHGRVLVCGSFHVVGPALDWLGLY
jgi:dihydrofolate synthase/folylpolyglutamate synthase